MEYRTILWPTDLSKGSLKAMDHVISVADKHQARVIVMYVAVDLCSYFPAYGNYPSPDLIQQFQGWEVEDARKKLGQVCDQLKQGCPNLGVKLVTGNAAEELLKAANEEKADLIVMTSRGHGYDHSKSGPTGLGRVAKEVLEKASVPVQVVQP